MNIESYRKGCLEMLSEVRGDLFDSPAVQDELRGMQALLAGEEPTAAEELTRGILQGASAGKGAMAFEAPDFNHRAETYYRTTLWSRHMQEGLEALLASGRALEQGTDRSFSRLLQAVIGERNMLEVIRELGGRAIDGTADRDETRQLISVALLIIEQEHRRQHRPTLREPV